ncbi:MAG: hypothetical protein IPM23_05925 [Candidatus Melainabacteria bacterium]|nr:hypothetical protein [Candidatus Melainabacteria bacterium]
MNNEKLIQFVKTNFVAVSGAVELLQPGRYGAPPSDESRWFEPIGRLAMNNFAPPGFWSKFKTYQGMYIIDSQGRLYDYKVGLAYDPDEFLASLDRALRSWRRVHPAKARSEGALTPSDRFISNPGTITASLASPALVPESTSIIEVYSRILPLPTDATLSERSIGRDLMWIFPFDCREMFEAAREPGKEVRMPARLVARLVRFQLLNHVGNIMRPFGDKDVRVADFNMKLAGSDGRMRHYSFSGTYRSSGATDGGRQWVSGSIIGELSIDSTSFRVKMFRAYGEANTLGGNDSLDNKRAYPVVFAMTEARHDYARQVVPFWAALPSLAGVYQNPSAAVLDYK